MRIRSTHNEALHADYPRIQDLRSGFNQDGYQSQPSIHIARFTIVYPETFSPSNLSCQAFDRWSAVNPPPLSPGYSRPCCENRASWRRCRQHRANSDAGHAYTTTLGAKQCLGDAELERMVLTHDSSEGALAPS
jgi:hypothetical protein